ncbi:helix-hairpin-helix domain-containing protein [Clostridium sp. D2Q-11]|uniref:Helix-hairpin-helix domain-containing protein n=1 Tax=Anaeromonas frigoriresistens TaxID=2683708 RepID=A0A942UQ60_9FIRM|nr:helix-hairpin-helix domain-containing protein [Anaeromonas frigoriresistens]MBS4537153.1 helix-hairpin-helix domain-containing protein [Anaeromonas frigoriresistens]
MISFTRKEQIVILILVIIIIGIISINLLFTNKNDISYEKYEEAVDLEETEDDISEEEPIEIVTEKPTEDIIIHITGAVNSPGIFTLKLGSRINDAVLAAGGLTSEADENRINLAKKVDDEEKIHIYKVGEEEISSLGNDNLTQNNSEDNNGKININTANQNELETLPGIGSVKANKIIEYRNSNKFNSIEDIMNVEGIGEKTFQNIQSKISI